MKIGKYVYTVVVEFINNKGETCRLTLGALSNPETFNTRKKNLKNRIAKLNTRLSKGEDVKEELDSLQEKLNAIPEQMKAYRE